MASVIVPEDGNYIIQVRESAYARQRRLPLPAARWATSPGRWRCSPPAGRPARSWRCRWLGDAAGPMPREVKLPGSPDVGFGSGPGTTGECRPLPNTFRVSRLRQRPGDRAQRRARGGHRAFRAARGPQRGHRQARRRRPFVFKAKKGQVFDIHVLRPRIRSPLDPVLTCARRRTAARSARTTTRWARTATSASRPRRDREYLISRDGPARQAAGPLFVYRIEVTPGRAPAGADRAEGAAELPGAPGDRGPPREPAGDPAPGEPAGHSAAGCPLGVEGLPAGVTVPGRDRRRPASTPCRPFCESAPMRPLAASLASAVPPAPTIADRKVRRLLREEIDLAWGRGTTPYAGRTADRLAVAVTEEAPLHDRDRGAEGAARPERLDGAPGARHAGQGFTAPIALRWCGTRRASAPAEASPSPRGRTRRPSP